MNTEREVIEVRGIPVEVVRKDIKNLHLAVYPPDGRVRVAIPRRLGHDDARLAVISRLAWIRRKQNGFKGQDRQPQREMVTGESHYFQGRRYRLDVQEAEGVPRVCLRNNRIMELYVRPGASVQKRREILREWYREELWARVEPLVAKWESIIGVRVAEWRVRRMKTRWGTCNAQTGRIWLNLELAKKPPACTEYILVHEMVHLLERNHTDRFRAFMDQFMPQWQLHREALNQAPLSHEEWEY